VRFKGGGEKGKGEIHTQELFDTSSINCPSSKKEKEKNEIYYIKLKAHSHCLYSTFLLYLPLFYFILQIYTAITCNVETLEECDEKEKSFIEKQKLKAAGSKEHYDAEFKRLKKMNGEGKMKPELKDWVVQRMGLLQRMKDEL
jgi:hypothetical protein